MANIFRAPREGISAMIMNLVSIQKKGNSYFVVNDPWEGYVPGNQIKVQALPEKTLLKHNPTFVLSYTEDDTLLFKSLSQMEQSREDYDDRNIPNTDPEILLKSLDELCLAYLPLGSKQFGSETYYQHFQLFIIERPRENLLSVYRKVLDFEQKEIYKHVGLRDKYKEKIRKLEVQP
ncbi:MAG: hypothetical protein ACP5N3_01680 [Candidatus Nanoarchaeia archaeon]